MTADEKLQKVNELLDAYEHTVGLPKYQKTPDYQRYMNLTQEQLQKLSSDELREAAGLLSDYALYVSRQLNRESARAKWCYEEIMRTIMPTIENYRQPFQSVGRPPYFGEREYAAIFGNEYAGRLHQLMTGCQVRAESLRMIPTTIEKLAEKLNALGYSKERQR